MTAFKIATKLTVLAVIAGLSGCSGLSGQKDYYGYEDDYKLPQQVFVPEMPDDKPGRTVDEMLELLPDQVTIVRAKDNDAAEQKTYEHEGRFGTKEKIALRKGLNAPDAKMTYSPAKRANVTVVRGLKLHETPKDELVAMTEQEMLSKIIEPKKNNIEMIEVVKRDDSENIKMIEVVKSDIVPKTEEIDISFLTDKELLFSDSAPVPVDISPKKEVAEQKNEPLVLTEPKTQPELKFELLPPAAENDEIPEKFELLLPSAARTESGPILLIPPAGMTNESSDDDYLTQEIGTVAFAVGKKALPATAADILKSAVQALKSAKNARLLLVAYDLPSGKEGSAETAKARAKLVADALKKKGVSASKIKTETEIGAPYGETVGRHVEIYLQEK